MAYSLPIASGKATNVVAAIPSRLVGVATERQPTTIEAFRKLLVKENPTLSAAEIDNLVAMVKDMKLNSELKDVFNKVKIG